MRLLIFFLGVNFRLWAAHNHGYCLTQAGATPATCTQANVNVVNNAAGAVDITEWCICKKVTNVSCPSPIFAPTGTALEWTTFFLNAPACVTISSCTSDLTKPFVLTTSGTGSLTTPTGCSHLMAMAWGAGGGSGSVNATTGNATSGAGGAGGYAVANINSIADGTTYSYNVGGGGTGGDTGAACVGGTAGTGAHTGGQGGAANNTSSGSASNGGVGAGSGGSSGTAGARAGTNFIISSGGVAGYAGGGGGSVGVNSSLGFNARCGGGGGGSTAIINAGINILIAGGGGGGGGARGNTGTNPIGANGGAACAQVPGGVTVTGTTDGGGGGGGGGGACGGTLLSSSTNGSGANPGVTGPSTSVCSTTLNLVGGINSSVTSITVASTTGCATSGTLILDSEQITYTGTTATTITGLTRGVNGTTASAHSNGASLHAWSSTVGSAVGGQAATTSSTVYPGASGAVQFIFY